MKNMGVLFQLHYDKKYTTKIESYQTEKASYSNKTLIIL